MPIELLQYGQINDQPFTEKDLKLSFEHQKIGKAPGLDGITTEQILHFGAKTK